MTDPSKQVLKALIESVALVLVALLAHPDMAQWWRMRAWLSVASTSRAVAVRAGEIALYAELKYNDSHL